MQLCFLVCSSVITRGADGAATGIERHRELLQLRLADVEEKQGPLDVISQNIRRTQDEISQMRYMSSGDDSWARNEAREYRTNNCYENCYNAVSKYEHELNSGAAKRAHLQAVVRALDCLLSFHAALNRHAALCALHRILGLPDLARKVWEFAVYDEDRPKAVQERIVRHATVERLKTLVRERIEWTNNIKQCHTESADSAKLRARHNRLCMVAAMLTDTVQDETDKLSRSNTLAREYKARQRRTEAAIIDELHDLFCEMGHLTPGQRVSNKMVQKVLDEMIEDTDVVITPEMNGSPLRCNCIVCTTPINV